ncbi:MAG TPA: response regulator [Janthinobacterium sp.]|nr:response regulator [Janthinobacterium sp.]
MFKDQHISIIDDDESVRLAINSLVRSLGLKTSMFDSAEAFMAAQMPCQTDCIVTDVQMPGLSGFDLLELLRRGDSRLPLIFVTAFPEEALRRRALAQGAICFLSKPFVAKDIIGCIGQALASPQPWIEQGRP